MHHAPRQSTSYHSVRPCLKFDETLASPAPSPFPFNATSVPYAHVHFPSTPNMTTTHRAHSPHTYDRKPIMVARNECALPERGGRIYTPRPDRRRPRMQTPAAEPAVVGSYFHPHAALACQPEPLDAPVNVPALIPDLASESDESDAIVTPPDAASLLPPSGSALNFLPHPPSAQEHRGRGRERERKRSSTPRRPPLVHRSSFAPEEDEGCLGGF
ncbi:unnamed protein product [Peniophora sp. CBMAI 1063]|nr:unnamed protein product [Peniophora sp. CBMAI 1063]